VASDRALDFTAPAPVSGTDLEAMARAGQQGFRECAPRADIRPFTDDWAPIEHLVDWETLRRPEDG
jgi:hypothetical protein